jgi:hypothetical protein
MADREHNILRYRSGAMSENESAQFDNERRADAALAFDIETDTYIDEVFARDAASFEQDDLIKAIPGAPLLERLSIATATPTSRRGLYYILGAAALLLALLMFLLTRSDTNEQGGAAPSSGQHTPQVITEPSQTNSTIPEQTVPSATNPGNQPHVTQTGHPVTATPESKPIDLDKGLQPPKTYTDPRGHAEFKK